MLRISDSGERRSQVVCVTLSKAQRRSSERERESRELVRAAGGRECWETLSSGHGHHRHKYAAGVITCTAPVCTRHWERVGEGRDSPASQQEQERDKGEHHGGYGPSIVYAYM